MQTSKWISRNLSSRFSSKRFHIIIFNLGSIFSKPRRVELPQTAERETLRENILIKRKLKPRLRNRNKKWRKKTLLDVKSIECIEGDKAPIQRLNGNKTETQQSGQTGRDEPLARTETKVQAGNISTEHRANVGFDDSEDQQSSYKDNFINSAKVRFIDLSQDQGEF